MILVLLAPNLFAQHPVHQQEEQAHTSQDPCQSPLRCEHLLSLGEAHSLSELTSVYTRGCAGYTEQALRALRAYQLKAPAGSQELLGTMPRGFGDITSMFFLTTAPNSEAVGDFRYFFQADGPQDQIPDQGCGDFDVAETKQLLTLYFESTAHEVRVHPRFMPRFLEVSQMFGHLADWEQIAGDGGYTPVDPVSFFNSLLRSLYKRDPAGFRQAARFTKFGPPALAVGTSPQPPPLKGEKPCGCSIKDGGEGRPAEKPAQNRRPITSAPATTPPPSGAS